MKFRSILLASITLLIAGIIAATVGSVAVLLQRAARNDITADLHRARQVFDEQRAYRESIHRSESRVVADEPRLKAVVATEDISPETVYGVAFELRKALQSDLFLITDGDGRLLADVLDPKATGFDMKGNPLVAGAIADGAKSGVWTTDGAVYEVQSRRLEFGTTTVGVLVIGYTIDERLVETVRRQTASLVVVELDGKPVAVSQAEVGGHLNRDSLTGVLASIPSTPPGSAPAAPTEVMVEGVHYLAVAAPLPGYTGTAKIRYVILRSLDRALAPAREVAQALYTIAAVALALALVLGVVLASRLSRPLDSLVAFVGRVAKNDLEGRAPLAGPREVKALGEAMNRMVTELGESRRQMVAKERLEKEMEISSRIQTSILPRRVNVAGLDVAARMIPATEVGGDYYDIFSTEPLPSGKAAPKASETCWIGIGDVAGHGLTSGLIMMMVQSAVAALCRGNPDAPPRDIVRVLNMVLFDNIRHRLDNDEHVTLSLMRYQRDGRIVYAGAHEEIIVFRAKTGRCELIPTLGPWVGAMNDIGHVLEDSEMTLEDGDLMVLYTDGVTEAMDKAGEQWGMDRLTAAIERLHAEPVDRIRDEIIEASRSFAESQEDDVTLLVIRYSALTA